MVRNRQKGQVRRTPAAHNGDSDLSSPEDVAGRVTAIGLAAPTAGHGMQYRHVGASGLRASAIGVGCYPFGGFLDETRSRDVVHAALDLGINYFDTANSYGIGASEIKSRTSMFHIRSSRKALYGNNLRVQLPGKSLESVAAAQRNPMRACGRLAAQRLFRFSSRTAKSAARAVRAMYVSDGFWHAVDVMHAPSVTKTLGASHT